MKNNTYYIYHCVGERKDGTTIERIFKIPSFWFCEMLATALITASGEPDEIKNFTIWVDEDSLLVDDYEYKSYGTPYIFEELEQPNMSVTINYQDGNSIKYACRKIGIDIAKNRINRLTPILVSLKGFSRFTISEYYKIPSFQIKLEGSYQNEEHRGETHIKKHFNKLYHLYLTTYFYTPETFEYDEEEY